MDAATRQLIRQRAGNRCEYCRSHQDDEPFFTFQIEHVIAKQHGGASALDNLALACPHCNLHKGPNIASIEAGALVPLFHPRQHDWTEHFQLQGATIIGLTPIGRATVRVLNMNDPLRVEVRADVLRRQRRRRS
ncbi:MAG TPA: HNH endonuclease signature motif containing protein [Gemmataceae bacterium]|nr:HNH endonuclease signature motif containing protein [Gemmataceae bacterium]